MRLVKGDIITQNNRLTLYVAVGIRYLVPTHTTYIDACQHRYSMLTFFFQLDSLALLVLCNDLTVVLCTAVLFALSLCLCLLKSVAILSENEVC